MTKSSKCLAALAAALLWLLPNGAAAEQVATSAKACVIMDAATGRVLMEHNADLALPMASTTKVMTALLALENGDLAAPVTCSRNAFGTPGTSIYLSQGETLTLEQMLYGLMLASGNDAACAIAEHIGGSIDVFCEMMTERAAQLGCTDTVFLTPHGLPCQGHHTTARDLALITREAMKHPFFRQLVSTQRATIPWEGRSYGRVLTNKNKLLSTYPGATGVKTGYTRAAGRCLVFSAQRDGLSLIGVVLSCADWFDEAARLLDLAFAHYGSVQLLDCGDAAGRIPVRNGDEDSVTAVVAADLRCAVPADAAPTVTLCLPDELEAPVACGQLIGEAQLMLNGECLTSVPIIADRSVYRNDWAARLDRLRAQWLLTP